MPYETVRCEVDESILTITLNRPDTLNAFTTQMLHEMIDAFDRADKDDAIRAVIVTGAGRAFCAGADLSGGGATFDRASRTDRPQIPLGPDGEPDLVTDAARDGGGRLALRGTWNWPPYDGSGGGMPGKAICGYVRVVPYRHKPGNGQWVYQCH
jgi:hypothetical protein